MSDFHNGYGASDDIVWPEFVQLKFRWDSIDFNHRLPSVWMEDDTGKYRGELRFESLADMKEMVYTLSGAINSMERPKRKGKTRAK